ncbi:MAG: glycoside hydrolase family 38 C-terminal domain-containing protein [Kiritimatiellae bacterium]|nr:glycoside hydrolase family 38 C-terminal domain-containing protein [Kiritimatiellia bacterium]MDD5520514.1 glycoside hydrolase family 38 C-terminal domain-containing protein [Kiritimatiellia bacterium]
MKISKRLFAIVCFATGITVTCVPGAENSSVSAKQEQAKRKVFVVSNFHPASCGWLANWSVERNYCANSYLDHLDRVRDDSNYNFALSECNNMIAIMNFRPERVEELKQRIREGRVELVNAFFLEPTINLSGGEALVRMGIEGLRWQEQVMGVRPRISWMIDVTGVHEQMAQIVAGLGLDALVYCRLNPTGSTIHWLESPDGTRILVLSPGHYLEWRPMFGAKVPLEEKDLQKLADDVRARIEPLAPDKDKLRPDAGDLRSVPRRIPAGAPVLIFGGSGDYSLAPLCKEYPSLFLEQFRKLAPEFEVQFSTPSRYLDAVLPGIKSGAINLPTMRSGTAFTYNAFWIQNPRVKTWYRYCEQQLQAAEMFSTAANIRKKFKYPVQPFYHAWLQMLLNMDRNTLWGAAGGMVFESEKSWDARDRFESVERISRDAIERSVKALVGKGKDIAVINPLNWRRNDPMVLKTAIGRDSQALPEGRDFICRLDLPAVSVTGVELSSQTPSESKSIALPPVIETQNYRARFDTKTGAMTSLQLKPSGREILGGPANVIVAEKLKKGHSTGDHMAERSGRERVTDSNRSEPQFKVSSGPLATVVKTESAFIGGARLCRTVIFYNDYPRIDFETELNDVSNQVVVVAEFPLASVIREVRRGIPYGFSHAAWGEPNPKLYGVAQGITPAVRWSHYQMAGAGMALLDNGLSGRELDGNMPVIFLLNAVDKYGGYPNSWLSGSGRNVVRYSLVAHAGDFTTAKIPQMAWEFNNPVTLVSGCAALAGQSFVQTSDNVIVESMRRDGGDIELRLAECVGLAGTAEITLNLPHEQASLTDLAGKSPVKLDGNKSYRFPVRPQQIVTMRFKAASTVPEIKPLTKWDKLVPRQKREALNQYLPDVKGHPPRGK